MSRHVLLLQSKGLYDALQKDNNLSLLFIYDIYVLNLGQIVYMRKHINVPSSRKKFDRQQQLKMQLNRY